MVSHTGHRSVFWKNEIILFAGQQAKLEVTTLGGKGTRLTKGRTSRNCHSALVLAPEEPRQEDCCKLETSSGCRKNYSKR